MNLSDLSHKDLYDELEKVIRQWQKLDAEWRRRWTVIQAMKQQQKLEAPPIWTPDNSRPVTPIDILPFSETTLDLPSIGFGDSSPPPPVDPSFEGGVDSKFDGGGGESGGGGSNGDW